MDDAARLLDAAEEALLGQGDLDIVRSWMR
jgi:hypothetical protein